MRQARDLANPHVLCEPIAGFIPVVHSHSEPEHALRHRLLRLQTPFVKGSAVDAVRFCLVKGLFGPPASVKPLPLREWASRFPVAKALQLISAYYTPEVDSRSSTFLKNEAIVRKDSILDPGYPRIIHAFHPSYLSRTGPWVEGITRHLKEYLDHRLRYHQRCQLDQVPGLPPRVSVASGGTAQSIGAWFDDTPGPHAVMFDGEKYDNSWNDGSLDALELVLRHFNVPKAIISLLLKPLRRPKGYVRSCAMKWVAPPQLLTGHPGTYLFNTLRNIWEHFPTNPEARYLVGGDDLLVIHGSSFVRPPYDSFGTTAKLHFGDRADATIFSSEFVPTTTGTVLVPKQWRFRAKVGVSVSNKRDVWMNHLATHAANWKPILHLMPAVAEVLPQPGAPKPEHYNFLPDSTPVGKALVSRNALPIAYYSVEAEL